MIQRRHPRGAAGFAPLAFFFFANLDCGGGESSTGTTAPATTLTSDDGRVTLEIPAGAGVDTTSIQIRARTDLSAYPRRAVFAYDLKPDGLQFKEAATFRWKGPLAAMGGTLTTPDISNLEIPLVLLRSHRDDADPAPEALKEQALEVDLDAATASFRGKLNHFSGVAAEDPTPVDPNTPDREKIPGRLAVAFMGIPQFPTGNVAPGATTAPVVGLRFWTTREVGIDVGLGVVKADDQTIRPGVPLALKSLRAPNDEARFDPPGVLPADLKAANKLTINSHYKFVQIPEVSLETTILMGLRSAQSCTDGDRRAAEIALGFFMGQPREKTCSSTPGTPGPTEFSTGATSKDPLPFSRVTSIQDTPWAIFTGSLSAFYYFSVFHCGPGDMGYTVCPTPATRPPEGEFHHFMMGLGDNVPLADPAYRYTYAFVLDSDGNPANNYKAPSNYPKDFYDDTDLWYEANYVPGTGWNLTAKVARGQTPSLIPTSARLVIKDNAIMLAVPQTELGTKKPRWRATTFRHKGDYGLAAPFDWSGDVEPPVGKLHETP